MIQRAIKSPIKRLIKSSISGVVSRFFTAFDDVAKSYVSSGGAVSTNGNVIEIEVSFTTLGGSGVVHNLINLNTNDSSEDFGLRIEHSGEQSFIKFYSSGFTPPIGTTNVQDGKLHKASARVNKTTGAYTVFLDGAVEYTGTHSNPSKIVTSYEVTIGARVKGGTQIGYLSGIAADAKVYNDGVIVFDMPIDQNYTPTNNTVIDKASSNNGTFINVADGDSVFYQFINDQWVDANGNVLEIA